jgi:glycosyltransferase involved in cell wall biosynthesis
MYRDAYPFDVVPAPRLYRLPNYFPEAGKLIKAVRGDLVIAVKAVGSTVPLAWWMKVRHNRRAAVYLDEWDGALMARRPRRERVALALRHLHHPLNENYFPLNERLIPRLDGVISTSTWLQRRFGGAIVPMGVDPDAFHPPTPDEAAAMRSEHGLAGFRLIVFGGVVRPHKGIDGILAAMVQSGIDDLRFVIVGPVNEHVRKLQEHPEYGPRIIALGPRPKAAMPRFLGLADLVVLPLQDDELARSQVPCKIFEAMATARPIIASAVSDLPLILNDCGWVVPPHDTAALAGAMREVFADPSEATRRGQAARARCLAEYSKPVAAAKLRGFVEHVLGQERAAS